MSINTMESELGSDYQVQESKIINHPEYSMPITVTRYGWAKRNRDTVWHTTKIEQALKDKNA
jgi:hypothetical protein